MILAILDTMWGSAGTAPRWFRINPRNHSGRRLYALTGARMRDLWVTNACPMSVRSAREHGTPNARWLVESLRRAPTSEPTVLLVCGKVAQATYHDVLDRYAYSHNGIVLEMPHPAARSWTRAMLQDWSRILTKAQDSTLSRRSRT